MNAQFFSLGQNPSSTRWQQIKRADFKVIFPEGNEKQAQYITNLMDTLLVIAYKDLPAKPRHFSIILQSQNVTPNGFVTLLPRRVELFGTGPQINEGTNWLDLLTIHEYRHVAQLSAIDQGFTHFLRIILGELGWGATLAVTTPTWYLEGDAVDFETKNTNFGRGNLGVFEQELLAQNEEQKNLNYEQLILGSFKQYRTNFYTIGYYLNNLINDSSNVTGDAFISAGKWPFFPYPFGSHIKKETGKGLYAWADSLIQLQDSTKSIPKTKTITHPKRNYTDFNFPTQSQIGWVIEMSKPDGISLAKSMNGWIAIRKQLDEIPAFVLVHQNGNEEILFRPGNIGDGPFALNSTKIVWSQKISHPRWNYKEFEELWEFNLLSKKKKRLTKNTRYQSPALSTSGKLAAIKSLEDGTYEIWEIGNVENKLANFEFGQFIYHPTWLNDSVIGFVFREYDLNQIRTLNVNSSLQEIVFSTELPIGYPSFKNGTWLFEINHETKAKIGRYKDGKLECTLPVKFGAQYPQFFNDSTLSFLDYHSYGKQICTVPIVALKWENIPQSSEIIGKPKIQVDNTIHEIKPYRKWQHLFNFHSWAPIPIDNETLLYGYGGSVFSQNTLSSSFTEIYYLNDPVTQMQQAGVSYNYEGFYPVLTYDYNFEENQQLKVDTFNLYQTSNSHLANVQFGHQYNGRRYIKAFRISSGYEFLHRNNYVLNRDNYFISERFEFIQSSFRYIWTDRLALRDFLAPRRFDLLLRSFHAPNDFNKNQTLFGRAIINHPSFTKNQVGQLSLFVKISDTTNVAGRNVMPNVNGGNSRIFGTSTQIKYHYHFPIGYPEWRIPYLAYFPRLRGYMGFEKLWEYGSGSDIKANAQIQFSEEALVGGITFDVNLFRYSYPIEVSLGASYYQNSNLDAPQWFFLPGLILNY